MERFQEIGKNITDVYAEIGRRNNAIYKAQISLPKLLSADATFKALQTTVDELSRTAPKDHDVLILAFNINVTKVRFAEPHTFIFEGFDGEGHATFVTCHFSQLVARVVYVPRTTERSRIITGFAREPVTTKK